MARNKVWGDQFLARMKEYDRSRGIEYAAVEPLRPAEEPSSRDIYGIEAEARSEWERCAAIRAEFSCLEAYVAYRRAEAKGLVRIISKKA